MALIQVRVLSNHAIHLVHSEIDKVIPKKHVLNLSFKNFIKYLSYFMVFFKQIYVSVLNALYHVVFKDSCKIYQILVHLILQS